MPRDQGDASYVWDMLAAAKLIREFVKGVDESSYRTNPLVQSAVERQVEIIGEAANRVSRKFCAANPDIPWRKIVAQRNVLAHEYGEIDERRIWELATRNIPELIAKLEPLLPPLPPEVH